MHEQNISQVKIPVSKTTSIEGNLTIPLNAKAVIIFAHGSGSGRFSPRNQYVAKIFNQAGLATLLVDLLTSEEETVDVDTGEFRFNINLLAKRLISATEWLKLDAKTSDCVYGYFGASTGAAAALIAAAKLASDIKAVVSRGGRPDLAADYLQEVRAPTLFLVGGLDSVVLELNQKAMDRMVAKKELVIIPGATHLFEEGGKLEEVAKLSTEWFKRYLR
jgi:putative phosphoribosyl transferase